MDNIQYRSRPKKEIAVPELAFEKFCAQYSNVSEIVQTEEWKEIYSNYYDFDDLPDLDVVIDDTIDDMEMYSLAKQKEEWRKCAKSFTYFCIKYAKIAHPMFGVINFVPYTYQKRVVGCFGEHRFNILSKFRQGGLTTVSVAYSTWRCLFKKGQRIMVVSKTDREAMAAGEVAKTIVEYLPKWLKPELDKFNDHEKQFKTTKSILWFYTVEAARGKSITFLIIDEAAFIPDMREHWKALAPVLSAGGGCAVISTVNGMGNWYEETYHAAENGENKQFNIIELDYWEHPLYNDPKWVEETKNVYGEDGWAQEVERSFLKSGNTWISPLIISSLVYETRDNRPFRMSFENWKNKGAERKNAWDEGALWIWKQPIEAHEYIIGVDVAEGAKKDNSCFQIIDTGTLEQVAEFYSNTVTPHVFSQILENIGYFYNTALIVVENVGLSLAVIGVLESDLMYENLYFEDNKRQTAGVKSSKTKRPVLLQALQQRLLNATLKINSSRFVNELNTFLFNATTKRPEAQSGSHDDAIFAMALALYVRDAQCRNLPAGADLPEETLKIYRTQVYEEIRREIMSQPWEDFMNEDTADSSGLYIDSDPEELMPTYRRKHGRLLTEFGW